ncbi:MAG TPA: tetratricopeptide repeat protein, partial [Planctomycetota bacterium]|nr:tetratricopeptide repeat protein [Planctomycetota bacterium]
WLLLEGAKEMRRGARGGGKDAFARSAALLASAALTSPRARPVTHFMLAFSASRAGDEVAARRCADAISALWPDSSRAWLCVGIALQRFDRDRSTSALRRAVELDPRSALAHDALGEALYESGDHAGAMAELVRAVELRPGLAVAHVTIGTVLRTKGDLPGAMASYRRAVSLDPMLASAHGDLGAALNDSRDFAGAAAECRRAIELDASMAPAHHNLGVSLFELGDVSGALAAYRRAIALDPSLALAHSGEGRCLEAAGDDAGALAAFRRAVELDRNVADAHAHVGDLLAKRGDFPAAIRSYRRAIELGESGAGVHEHLADALRRSGDEAGAKEAVARSREALERETRRNAGDAGAWNELAWFLVDPEAAPEQRDPRAALPAARKSVELSASDDPNLPNRLDTLAEALFATGDAVAAVAAEERAVAALDRSHVRNEPLRAGFVRSLARYRGAGDGDASRPRAEH